ncbi:hypothetical protein J4526_05850 [Desulfurococcaceae archaeon MEX13E-LK6-19]|nr:hypothetical protein J4526_05850 [Desulfurococcaceae archaeon MEX13E-LK6-19]
MIAYIKGVSMNFNEIINMLNNEPYLASYAEVVGMGGLPLVFTLFCKDEPQIYGLRREGMLMSLALSLPLIAINILARILYGSPRFESFNLLFPYNIWYAFLGVFAYGPLEVFFVIWLIVNTDLVFKSIGKVFSPGLLITVLVFGLSHIVLSPQGGIVNAISVTITWLILGLVFKYTKNSIGPMIAWTLINGQVFYLLIGCLS